MFDFDENQALFVLGPLQITVSKGATEEGLRAAWATGGKCIEALIQQMAVEKIKNPPPLVPKSPWEAKLPQPGEALKDPVDNPFLEQSPWGREVRK